MAYTSRESFALRTNERFFYGWAIVAVGALGIFASGPGQSHIFSVYYPRITDELNLSYFEVTTAYALATLVVSFALPLLGKQVDRIGPRRVLLVVAALFGLAAAAFSIVDNLVVLALAFAALRFLGQGSLMLGCNNMVSQWFSRKRGLALSILSWGFAISMAFHPVLAEWLSGLVGWRQSWLWLALLTWALLLPTFWWFAHDRPEKLGLRPDGRALTPAGKGDAGADDRSDDAEAGMTLQQARRTPTFWIVTASLMTLAGLVTALFLNQVTIMRNQGLASIGPISMGTMMFFVTAFTMVLCVPVFGRLLDRFPPRRIFCVALLLMSAALLLITFADNLPMAICYAIVFGLSNASIHAHYVFLWAHYFGRKHLGSIQGFGQSLAVVGASLLPLPFAAVYDWLGSFEPALYAGALIPVVCAVFVWNMPKPVIPTRA